MCNIMFSELSSTNESYQTVFNCHSEIGKYVTEDFGNKGLLYNSYKLPAEADVHRGVIVWM